MELFILEVFVIVVGEGCEWILFFGVLLVGLVEKLFIFDILFVKIGE